MSTLSHAHDAEHKCYIIFRKHHAKKKNSHKYSKKQ